MLVFCYWRFETRVPGIRGIRREGDRAPQVLGNGNPVSFKGRKEGVDVVGEGIRDLLSDKNSLECLLGSLLRLETEIFIEYTRDF